MNSSIGFGPAWLRKVPMFAAVALAVSACEVPQPVAQPAPAAPAAAFSSSAFTTELLKVATEMGLAQVVAESCPRQLRYNETREDAVIGVMVAKYGDSPASRQALRSLEARLRTTEMQRKLQNDAIDYIRKRNIVVNVPSTWCTAGRAEIAQKTPIGKFLIAR